MFEVAQSSAVPLENQTSRAFLASATQKIMELSCPKCTNL